MCEELFQGPGGIQGQGKGGVHQCARRAAARTIGQVLVIGFAGAEGEGVFCVDTHGGESPSGAEDVDGRTAEIILFFTLKSVAVHPEKSEFKTGLFVNILVNSIKEL